MTSTAQRRKPRLHLPLIIEGPTAARGTFFIRDAKFRVWDGAAFRGFGFPEEWRDYQQAFSTLRQIKRTAAKGANATRTTA